MKIKPLFNTLKTTLISSILVASFFFSSTQNAVAVIDQVRETRIENGRCVTDTIDVISPTNFGSKDILWELDNPVCMAYIAGVATALFVAETVSSIACYQPQAIAEAAAGIAAGVGLSPAMIKRRAKEAAKCTALLGVGNYSQAALCCGGMVSTMSVAAQAVAVSVIIWKAARDTQSNAHLCGETWNNWEEIDAQSLNEFDGEGIPNYIPGSIAGDKFHVYGKRDYEKNGESFVAYQKEIEEGYLSGARPANIKDKEYREYIYGGQEFEDNDNEDGCPLPNWSDEDLDTILGYSDGKGKQRYYMRGPKLASNYACSRFLLHTGSQDSGRTAYECCKKRSQNTICIEEENSVLSSKNHRFCEVGTRCKIQDVVYEIHPAKKVPNYICATTYSVCPYNHNLGGGTEIAEYYPKHQDILKNHCQYLKHCVKIPGVPYIRTSDLDGGWISSACFDLKGDSQNNYGYNAQLLPINTKHFSAPIAQCFKETFENMFINKAGHTSCSDPDEFPDQDGNCDSGYIFKEGRVIANQESFFQSIQDNLQTAIKMVMTLAVTIMGIGVLLTGKVWDKKTLMKFLVKFSLVAYFVLGTAWQDTFFNGVSNTSMVLADIFMRVDVSQDDNKKDGCQFPKYNSQTMETNGTMDVSNPSYPPGKEYLAIWDMLDCKIARALGFGPEVSVPNLIMMILAGFLSGPLGAMFFVAAFIFAFYLIALTVRALHIFLISSIAITMLIYVSPITITACLFKRTEGIFTKWRTHLMGYVMQPVILFCYLGILITIFENTIIGDATFSGDGINTPKNIECSGNAQNNSIYCIFRVNDIKTNNFLAPIGIGLPVLFNMNQEKIFTIAKGAFLMFIFTKFLDKIISLAAGMVGGKKLAPKPKTGALSALGKAYGATKAVQSRGQGAAQKWGGKAARKIGSTIKSGAAAAGKRSSPQSDGNKASVGKVADASSASSEEIPNEGKADTPRSSGDMAPSGASGSSGDDGKKPSGTPGVVSI